MERAPGKLLRATLAVATVACPPFVVGQSGFGFSGYRWLTDFPAAERHLLEGIQRLTRIDTGSQDTAVRLEDDALFDRPQIPGMDLGDAWEHADNPIYPQPLTGLAYRFAINHLFYSMTH